MNMEELKALAQQYQERFGNIDEIAHPSIMFDEQFAAQLNRALETGVKLEREHIDTIFPDVPWNE